MIADEDSRGAHASRVHAWSSRPSHPNRSRRDAESCTRDGCAPRDKANRRVAWVWSNAPWLAPGIFTAPITQVAAPWSGPRDDKGLIRIIHPSISPKPESPRGTAATKPNRRKGWPQKSQKVTKTNLRFLCFLVLFAANSCPFNLLSVPALTSRATRARSADGGLW